MAVYSHSRISSFENCRLQYRFRYVDNIRRDVESIEAFMGKLVHEVLEGLYGDVPRARELHPEEFGEQFEALWRLRHTPNVRIVRESMSAEDYRAIGRRCVESYHRRHHPFEGAEVMGCETEVEFPIDRQGLYRMRGFIDRVDRAGHDVLEIHDYKTGALPREGVLKRDRQLSLYEIAMRQRHPEVREVRQVWHYLAHDRTFVETRSLDDLRKTGLETIRSIQTIEATTQFPARRSALCSWCEYREICPEWEAERAASALQPDTAPEEPIEPPGDITAYDAGTGQYRLFG
ncbi:MAG: RecB family exonuclease [Candidatus Polarisedimenticolia bacterium]